MSFSSLAFHSSKNELISDSFTHMNGLGIATDPPQLPASVANDVQDMVRVSIRAQEAHIATMHGAWVPVILKSIHQSSVALEQLTDAMPGIGEPRIFCGHAQ